VFFFCHRTNSDKNFNFYNNLIMLSPLKSILSNILRKEIIAVSSQVPESLRSLLERSDHQDPLERKQFEITNLNDLRDGALANIYDAQSHSRR